MNKAKYSVDLEAPVFLGESSVPMGLCSSEMRSLHQPGSLTNPHFSQLSLVCLRQKIRNIN